MSLGLPEIILILVLALLLFGARKLPELGKGFGQGIREFKKSTRDGAAEDDLEPAEPVRVATVEPAADREPRA